MLSSVYQQGSQATVEASRDDVENRLLSHQNRRRLDFEAMRDSLLAVSGRLDVTTVGGKPMPLFDAPFPVRRTIYGLIDRQNLDGVYRTFDFASPDASCPRRFVTTVPQQALFLMNGGFLTNNAHAAPGSALARILDAPGGDAEKIKALYLRTLSRRPTPEEVEHWTGFVDAPREEALAEGAPAPGPKGGGGARAAFIGERRLARAERLLPRRETPKQQAFEDVLWALLNSSEFTFNH